MNSWRTWLALATAIHFGCFRTQARSLLPPLVVSSGTTTLDSGGRPWVYVTFGENRPGLIAGHHFTIFVKTGPTGNFVARGGVGSTLDPAAIRVMLSRGASVGDSLPALEEQLMALHAYLLTTPGQLSNTNAPSLPLAQRLAMLQNRASGDTSLANLLDFYGISHPALRLVRGTAWAGRLDVPMGTEIVVEVRESDDVGKDITVAGRLTLRVGQPEALPAPGPLVVVPEDTAQGDLSARLRWVTSDALRLTGTLHQGDVVWRLPKDLAESKGMNKRAPAAADLDSLVISGAAEVRRLPGPVFPGKLYDTTTVGNFSLDRTNSYAADDHDRFAVGGIPFAEGSRYYYFAAAVDALGRPGSVSDGLLVTLCRRIPPHLPSRLKAMVQWNRTNHQYWDISWQANASDFGTPTTRYELFRGNDFARLTAAQRGQLNLDTLPLVPGNPGAIQRLGSVDDPGVEPGPTLHFMLPGDGSYGTNWWFAIRAIHASPPGCPDLASSLSTPALSALHDSARPVAPDLVTQPKPIVDCLRVACIVDHPPASEMAEGNTNHSVAYYIARCQRTSADSGINAAHFRVTNASDGTEIVPELVAVFPPDEDVVEFAWTMPLAQVGVSLNVDCKAEAFRNYTSEWVRASATGVLPAGNSEMAFGFLAGAIAESERLALSKGDRLFEALSVNFTNWPGDTHLVVSPTTGRILHPQFKIQLGAKAKQYRLYRRIENGPLTLIAQGLQDYAGPGSMVMREDSAPPVSNGRVDYFSQFLDENSVPSGMRHLAHLTFTGDSPPIPIMVTPSPADFGGTLAAPNVTLSWIEPAEHVERFEVHFSTDKPASILDQGIRSLVTRLNPKTNATPVSWKLRSQVDTRRFLVVTDEQSFLTGRVGGDLGPGPRFTVTLQVDPALIYHAWIVGLGPNGEPSGQSRHVDFQWQPPSVPPSNIAWPQRPLPPVAVFNSGIQALDFRDILNTRLIWDFRRDTAVQIPLYSVAVDSTPIGIRVGSLLIDNDASKQGFDTDTPSGPIFHTSSGSTTLGRADPNTQVFTRDGDKKQLLLPCVLYRTQVANSAFPNVSGDVIQCSPLIKSIAWISYPLGLNGEAYGKLVDPLFRWIGPDLPSAPTLDLYLVDTQPVIQGARYRYWLLRFSQFGEPVQTVPCGEVTVKSP